MDLVYFSDLGVWHSQRRTNIEFWEYLSSEYSMQKVAIKYKGFYSVLCPLNI